MSGITSRIATVGVALALLAAGLASTAHGAVGPYGPAHANCYNDGVVSTTLNFDKLGLGAQSLGWNIHYWDIHKGAYTDSTGWHTFYTGAGTRLGTFATDYRRIAQGHYYLYTEYAWNFGSGWSYAGAWAGSYLTGADFFGVPESFCRAAPILQTVRGCADFGTDIPTIACASRTASPRAGRTVRRPSNMSAINRLQRSRTVQRLMRHHMPAPPQSHPIEPASL
jgi:hypothetical protein